jgi:hypothetical protein
MKTKFGKINFFFPIGILIILFIAGCSESEPDIQEIAFGIVYGEHHAFMIKPPPEWVIDKKLAKENELGAIFYPRDAKDKLEVYMYATAYDKVGLESPDINDFIAADIETYKKDSTIKIRKVESLETFDNTITHTYEFEYPKKNEKEFVSYIDTKSAVCVLVYTYKDTNNNDRFIEDYKIPFVKSFKYLGDDPEKARREHKKFMEKPKKESTN